MHFFRAIKGVVLSFVFLMFFSYLIFGFQTFFKRVDNSRFGLAGSISGGLQDAIENTKSIEQEPEILAESAISIRSDLIRERNVVFVKNFDKQLPIASLTKLMTAVVVLDNYDLSKIIYVAKIADSQYPMWQDVKLGDKMAVENFLDLMIISSSNKAAYALSQVAGAENFVKLMNQKARQLGMENTFFVDPTGLSPKNVSTVDDLAKLSEHILLKYPRISNISRLKEYSIPGFGKVLNTDQLLGEFPEAVCSKTGFTEEAKGCLLLVTNGQENKKYLINIILGAEDRFSEMRKLINWSSDICN